MKLWVYLGGFLVGMVAFVLYLSGRPESGMVLGVLALIGASVPIAAFLWWQKRRGKRD